MIPILLLMILATVFFVLLQSILNMLSIGQRVLSSRPSHPDSSVTAIQTV
jgi:hypothetical protein